MLAGVSPKRYFSFMAASLFSMFLGSQFVHAYYRPLNDLDKYVENEINMLPEAVRDHVRTYIKENSEL